MWGLDNATNIVTVLLGIAGFVLSIVSIRVPNILAKVSLWTAATALLLFLSFSVGGSVRTTQLTKANTVLERDNSDLSTQVRDLQIKVGALETANQTLNEKLNDVTQRLDEAESRDTEAINVELANLRQDNVALKAALDEALATISELSNQIAATQNQRPPVSDSSVTSPSALPPTNLVQLNNGTTYTIVETKNDAGRVTVFVSALNEGEEDTECLRSRTKIFDVEGKESDFSYYIINDDQASGLCNSLTLPSRIQRRFGIVFDGISPTLSTIAQLTMDISGDDAVFTNIPIPYPATNTN